MNKLIIATGITLLTTGCAPVIIGGGALVGTTLMKDKGFTGSIRDTNIANSIRTNMYKTSKTLFRDVSVSVENGEVVLTGHVAKEEDLLEASRIAWNTKDVDRVSNYIKVDQQTSISQDAVDSFITSTIKTSLMFDPKVKSGNYSIKTVNNVVYIIGTAQNKDEMNRIIHQARNTANVKRVISDIKIK